jgi:hypothetical protein
LDEEIEKTWGKNMGGGNDNTYCKKKGLAFLSIWLQGLI